MTYAKTQISVLTPTWNRADHLKNVWLGLSKQTNKDFEWIVANDGSEDDTIDVVCNLATRSDFPVTLINASCRIGKSRMDNELAKAARGEFIIWCDSDDVLLPNALEMLMTTWNAIPAEQRDEFCGVSALCDTEHGVLGNIFYHPDEDIDLRWNDLFTKLNSDLVIFTRADLVKAHPFLEVDFLIPESSVWGQIGIKKTRFIPHILKRVEYGRPNAISYSGHMSYNRGNAHAMAMGRFRAKNLCTNKEKLIRSINYIRYCRHGDIHFTKAIKLWNASKLDIFMLLILFPISQILALKDAIQGKVRKTHIDFIKAQKVVRISSTKLNF